MAAENSKRSILKTYTSTSKSTFTLVTLSKCQYFMYACIGYDDHVFISLKPAHCMSYSCLFKRSPLGVEICLSQAQIGLL